MQIEEEEQLKDLVDNLYNGYQEEGFDLNTDMTFNDIFKKVFGDAVRMTIEILESAEEDEEESIEDDLESEV
jgi:hypothetical protein